MLTISQKLNNTFNNLDVFVLGSSSELNELDAYLAALYKNIPDTNVLSWWRARQGVFPHLVIMAISYFTISGVLSG